MSERVAWEELPSALRRSIEERTGAISARETMPAGINCSTALAITTEKHGRIFLKGVRADDESGLNGLRFEHQINGTLAHVSPPIKFHVEASGWYCLGFTFVNGRHADYRPDTRDLPAITLTLRRMGNLRTPKVRVETLAGKFRRFLPANEAHLLAGSCLLHMDSHPHNVLITPGRAHFVDWARAALGPAWVDPAYMATWLMAYGHDPEKAIEWLGGFPCWRRADPRAVEAFVEGSCRQWTEQVGEKDAQLRNDEFHQLLDYPHEWRLSNRSL